MVSFFAARTGPEGGLRKSTKGLVCRSDNGTPRPRCILVWIILDVSPSATEWQGGGNEHRIPRQSRSLFKYIEVAENNSPKAILSHRIWCEMPEDYTMLNNLIMGFLWNPTDA